MEEDRIEEDGRVAWIRTDFFYKLHMRKMSRRDQVFGFLLGAVAVTVHQMRCWGSKTGIVAASRASCYIRCGIEDPELGLLQCHWRAVTSEAV